MVRFESILITINWNVPLHETNYYINLYKGVSLVRLLIRVENEVRVIFVQIYGHSLIMC